MKRDGPRREPALSPRSRTLLKAFLRAAAALAQAGAHPVPQCSSATCFAPPTPPLAAAPPHTTPIDLALAFLTYVRDRVFSISQPGSCSARCLLSSRDQDTGHTQ